MRVSREQSENQALHAESAEGAHAAPRGGGAFREADPNGLAIGSIFQRRYRIVRRIQAGGTAAVFEVKQLETERPRALKIMLPEVLDDPLMCARFRREATVTAAIHSDHIVETLDAGVDEATGAPFLVMELLRGDDLATVLARNGRMSPRQTVTLLAQLASALDKIHAAGIVHRDLKPENLFLTSRDDGSPCLKVLDFGIAKIVAPAGSGSNATRAIGTPVYMSPEQIRGDVPIGPATDLNAIAQIAYTLMVGVPYWHEESQGSEGMYRVLHAISAGVKEPALERARRCGAALPPTFDAWFGRATFLAPEARFSSAGEMIRALERALEVERGTGPPAHASGNADGRGEPRDGTVPLPRERRSHALPRSIKRVALGGALAALGLGGFALLRYEGSRSPAPSTEQPVTSSLAATTSEPPTSRTAETVAPGASAQASSTALTGTPAAPERVKKVVPSSRQPTPAVPSGTVRSCNPPFTVDADGIKHARPECL
jgi:serine/threonine-protein kinase